MLRSAGANDDSQVVLFGDNNNWFAAYALWMLELYGVSNTGLMNGGQRQVGGRGSGNDHGRTFSSDRKYFCRRARRNASRQAA